MDPKIFPIGYSRPNDGFSQSLAKKTFNKVPSLRDYNIRSYSHIKRAANKRWDQKLETKALKAFALYESPANDKPWSLAALPKLETEIRKFSFH